MVEKTLIEDLARKAFNEQPSVGELLSAVDVSGIAMMVGAVIHRPPRDTYRLLPSYISSPPHQARALLPDCLTERQRRNEIAHRLGHHFLHQSAGRPTVIYCQPQFADAALCHEAILFARELLLPEAAIQKAVSKGEDASGISYMFEVTLAMAEERLAELHL